MRWRRRLRLQPPKARPFPGSGSKPSLSGLPQFAPERARSPWLQGQELKYLSCVPLLTTGHQFTGILLPLSSQAQVKLPQSKALPGSHGVSKTLTGQSPEAHFRLESRRPNSEFHLFHTLACDKLWVLTLWYLTGQRGVLWTRPTSRATREIPAEPMALWVVNFEVHQAMGRMLKRGEFGS